MRWERESKTGLEPNIYRDKDGFVLGTVTTLGYGMGWEWKAHEVGTAESKADAMAMIEDRLSGTRIGRGYRVKAEREAQ